MDIDKSFSKFKKFPDRIIDLSSSLAEDDMPCLSKQYRSRSVGF